MEKADEIEKNIILEDTQEIKNIETDSSLEKFINWITGRTLYEEEIIEYISQKIDDLKRKKKDLIIPLRDLYQDIHKEHKQWNIDVKSLLKLLKKLQKAGIINKLEKLDGGFYLVHFEPIELSEDPVKLLEYAKRKNFVLTQDEILKRFSWTPYRMDIVLDYLQNKDMVRVDSSYLDGTRYFFI